MTLLAASRLTNIEKSLNVYLEQQLVTIAGFVVVFPREGFQDELPGSWVEISYIPMSEEFSTRFCARGWGSERMLLVNCNIFEQRAEQIGLPGGLANQYTLTVMVDQVMDVLGPRASIAIRDYGTAGNPTVGYFGWRQIRAQRVPGGVATGLEQVNVSCTLAFSQEHL